jgi:hypothetical protein
MLAQVYPPLRDLRLSGHVIHTGRSSMEVAVQLVALDERGSEETLMLGKFFGDTLSFAPREHGSRSVLHGLPGCSRRVLQGSPTDPCDP